MAGGVDDNAIKVLEKNGVNSINDLSTLRERDLLQMGFRQIDVKMIMARVAIAKRSVTAITASTFSGKSGFKDEPDF